MPKRRNKLNAQQIAAVAIKSDELASKRLEIVYRPIDSLTLYAKNPRRHSEADIDRLAASIREFGFPVPILARSDGEIIDGHLRFKAAKRLMLARVPVILCDGWTDAQVRAFRLVVNRSVSWAEWDDDLLKLEFEDLKLADFDLELTGFDLEEIAGLTETGTEGLTDPDAVPESPENPVSVLGDLWILGGHRLLCGDSTKADDVGRLMDGEKAHCIFTDPPYGVAYDGGAKKRDALVNDGVGTCIYAAALPLLARVADDSAAFYLWYADGHAAAAAAAAAGYQIVAQIIWAKNHAQFVTSAHYKGKHEPCYYGHKRGKTARWYGPNNEVTLWEYDRASSNDFHPTQKPVELATRAIRNSTTRGHIVLDGFSGGGATLIACEQLNRKCRAIEIEPRYVDVAVRRWQSFVGKDAINEATGKTFNETRNIKGV